MYVVEMVFIFLHQGGKFDNSFDCFTDTKNFSHKKNLSIFIILFKKIRPKNNKETLK